MAGAAGGALEMGVRRLRSGSKRLWRLGVRGGGRTVSLAAWCLLGVAGLLLGLAVVLLVRLGEPTPLPVTGLARRILAAAGDPAALRFDALALRWPVLRDGPGAPVIVAVRGLAFRVGGASGRVEGGTLALRPAPLLAGRVEPVRVGIDGAALSVTPAPASGGAGDRVSVSSLRRHAPDHLALRRVRVRWNGAMPVDLAVGEARLDRDRAGALSGAAVLDGSAMGQRGTARVALSPLPDGASALRVRVDGFRPAGLPLAVAPAGAVALAADATLDGKFRLAGAELRATGGAGTATIGGKAVPFAGITVRIAVRPVGPAAVGGIGAASLRLPIDAVVRLAGPQGGRDPVVTASGSLRGVAGAGGSLAGGLRIGLDQVPAADLGRYWPDALARGARRWITANIPVGTVSGVGFELGLASADGLGGLGVIAAKGGFDARGLAVHWLRPIAPITEAAGRVAFPDEDTVLITLRSGRQGPIDVGGSTMRITGLSAPEQIGRIAVRIRGPLPAALGILSAPRLRLLSRRPLSFDAPSGTVDGRVTVTLPLDDAVRIDAIGIVADARLASVHLGDVVRGRPVDDGSFRLRADVDGLRLDGTARIASLPATVALGMDFRAGPPDAVTETLEVDATASAGALGRAGLPVGGIADGVAVLRANYALRRDKRADIRLGADLAGAALHTPLGWDKAAGAPARIDAALVLDDGRLAAIDRLEATGPGLVVRSHAIVAGGGVRGLALDRVVLGRSDATGRLLLGDGERRPLSVALRGDTLDLVPVLRRNERSPPRRNPQARRSKSPWVVALDYRQVLLPEGRVLHGLAARMRGVGSRPVDGDVTAGAPAPLSLSVRPIQGGRTLAIRAADAGAVLAALAVTDDVTGGALTLDGRFDDGRPDDPFSGHLAVERFTLQRAPWAARLLRDVTIYGLLDRTPSPGLAVTRLDAPIRIDDDVLELDEARVWQPAIGLTASGTAALRSGALDLHGTIVPAYAVNALPGKLPMIGKLFSPERGGGVFAATWRVKGPAAHPVVSVNPLAALVPGVLRTLLAP